MIEKLVEKLKEEIKSPINHLIIVTMLINPLADLLDQANNTSTISLAVVLNIVNIGLFGYLFDKIKSAMYNKETK